MADDLEEALKALQGALQEEPEPPKDVPRGTLPASDATPALSLESVLAREAISYGDRVRRYPQGDPVFDPTRPGRDERGFALGVKERGPPPATPRGFNASRWNDIVKGHLNPGPLTLAQEIHDANVNTLRAEGEAIGDESGPIKDYLLKDVAGGFGRGIEGLFAGAVGLGHAGFEAVQEGARDLAMEAAGVPQDEATRTLFRERMGDVPAKALRERAFGVAEEALFGRERAQHMARELSQREGRGVAELLMGGETRKGGASPAPPAPKDPEEFINPTYKGFTLFPFATEAAGGRLLKGPSLGLGEETGLGGLAVAASNVGPLALDIATPAEALTRPGLAAGRALRAFEEARKGVSEAASVLIGKTIATPEGLRTINGVLQDGRVLAKGVRDPIDLVPLSRFKVADEVRDEVLKLQAKGPGLLQKADAAVSRVWDKAVGGAIEDIGGGLKGMLGDIHPKIPEQVRHLGRLAVLGRAAAVSEELGATVNAHSAERRWSHALAGDKASRLKQALGDADADTLEAVTRYIGGDAPLQEEGALKVGLTTPASDEVSRLVTMRLARDFNKSTPHEVLQALHDSPYAAEAHKEVLDHILKSRKVEGVGLQIMDREQMAAQIASRNYDLPKRAGEAAGEYLPPDTWANAGKGLEAGVPNSLININKDAVASLAQRYINQGVPQEQAVVRAFTKYLSHEYVHAQTLTAMKSHEPFERAMEQIRASFAKAFPEQYGASSPYEFVAEAISSPSVQKKLASLPASGLPKSKTMLEEFRNLIDKILTRLGVKDEVRRTLLDESFEQYHKIVDPKAPKSRRIFGDSPPALSRADVPAGAYFPKSLSPKVKEVADDIREVIKGMRATGLARGTISKETFDEFLNGYLVRVYESSLERALSAGGKEGERIAARMDLPRIRKNAYGGVFNMTEDKVKILIPEEDQALLVYEPHQVKGRTLVKFENSADGDMALRRLLERTTEDDVAFTFKPLSPEERKALDEVTDPVELTKMTLQKIGRENADAGFLNSIAANPQYTLPEGAAPEGWVKVTDQRFGPLFGKYVDPRVHSVIEQKVETDRGFQNFIRGMVGAFRANMLFTPRTATRNMLSNFGLYAPLNGVDPLDPKMWPLWGESAGELARWKSTGQMSPDIAAMLKGGMEMDPLSAREVDFILDIERVGSGVHRKEHSAEAWGRRLMHYATGSPLIDEGTKVKTAAARGGAGAVTRGAKAALEGKDVATVLTEAVAGGAANAAVIGPAMEVVQAAYNGGDKWLKVTAFKGWRNKALAQGMDAQQATLYAIQQTSKMTQNFGEVGGLAGFLTGRGTGAGATLGKIAGFPFAPSFWDQHAKILARSMKEQPITTLAMMSRRYALDATAWAGIVGGGAMTQEQYTRWRRENPEKVPIPGADGKIYGWDDTYLFPGFPRMGTSGAPQFEGAEQTFGKPENLPATIASASPLAETVFEGVSLAKGAKENEPRSAESLFTGAPLVRGEQTVPEAAASLFGSGFSNPLSPAYGRDIKRIEDTLTKKYKGRLPDEKGEREPQSLALAIADIFGIKVRETAGARATAAEAFSLSDQIKDAQASIKDAAKEATNYLSRDEGERRLRRAAETITERMLKALDTAVEKGLEVENIDDLKAAIRRDMGKAIEEQVKGLRR